MGSLFLRNLIFTILQPGVVCIGIPWLILNNILELISKTPSYILIITCGCMLVGACILCYSIYLFATVGHGTLSPLDPTKNLVIIGLYKYSRNPMYVGVMLILLSECLLFQNQHLLNYTLTVFILFNIFIIFVEEPRLVREFGHEYSNYCKQVRRWLWTIKYGIIKLSLQYCSLS